MQHESVEEWGRKGSGWRGEKGVRLDEGEWREARKIGTIEEFRFFGADNRVEGANTNTRERA